MMKALWRLQLSLVLLAFGAAACDRVESQPESVDTIPTAQVSPTASPTVEIALPTVVPEAVPSPTPTPSPAPTAAPPTGTAAPHISSATPLPCWGEGGHFEHGTLRTDKLPLPMEYSVYLPPCYEQQVERRYPVLYLIHGQNYNHDQWDRLGADEAASALIAAGDLLPFIIVMPRDRSWAQPADDLFGQVLAEELVPYVDASYRTLPEREYRAVGGLSRGAGWAVHLGLSYWELFGAIGGHSLPVFWSDTSRVRGWLADIPPKDLPRIYLDIGEKDRTQILASARWFEELLTELGIPHEWHLFTGYHEEAYWQAHVEDYLRWYAQDW